MCASECEGVTTGFPECDCLSESEPSPRGSAGPGHGAACGWEGPAGHTCSRDRVSPARVSVACRLGLRG